MRSFLSLLCLVVMLSVTQPAQAQFRQDVQTAPSATQLYGSDASVGSLNDLFSPEHFRMSHSYEASFSSFGGNAASMGMYTNSMMWQFNSKLAARVDVSVAHSLTGGAPGFQNNQRPRVFLRNAEVAYRPSENMEFRFQVRQSPYGRYAGPYGYSPYNRYQRSAMGMQFSGASNDLFWRN